MQKNETVASYNEEWDFDTTQEKYDLYVPNTSANNECSAYWLIESQMGSERRWNLSNG